jgi:flagellar basal body-associated protein FliL
MYIGGGILFIIIFALILLPIIGVAFWFPFSEADENGFVNYRSTETLYYNEFWYEYENIEEGHDISYSIQSSSVGITFAIWDRPFDSLPTETIEIDVVDSFTLPIGWRIYEWNFLRPGSSILYEFNTSGQVDFFYANWNEFEIWDQFGPNPSFYIENTTQESGSFAINTADDYFLVWYNEGGPPIDVDYTINYTATNVIDFSSTFETQEDTTFESGTFPVTHSGNWYFFIYFDPMNVPPPDASTEIRFDVTYDTGKDAVNRWLDIQWILIIILVIVIILLIAALLARIGQKKLKLKEPTEPTPKVSPYKKVIKKVEEPKEVTNCIRCNSPLKPTQKFCTQCGGKVEGRKIGGTSVVTPAAAKSCSLCGSKLSGTEKFCKWCGTKIEI